MFRKKDVVARKSIFEDNSGSSGEKHVSLMFGSYVNGSNNVGNSCHQDALLVVMSEIFNRHPDFFTSSPVNAQQTKAFEAFNRAWNLNCNDKLHDSKIILLSWLKNEICNDRIYYTLGNQCSLEAIIHSLRYYMTQEERKIFSLVTSVSRKYCKFGNHVFPSKERQSGTFKMNELNWDNVKGLLIVECKKWEEKEDKGRNEALFSEKGKFASSKGRNPRSGGRNFENTESFRQRDRQRPNHVIKTVILLRTAHSIENKVTWALQNMIASGKMTVEPWIPARLVKQDIFAGTLTVALQSIWPLRKI